MTTNHTFSEQVEKVRQGMLKDKRNVLSETKTMKAQKGDIPPYDITQIHKSYINEKLPGANEKFNELRTRRIGLRAKYDQLFKEEHDAIEEEMRELEVKMKALEPKAIEEALEQINQGRTRERPAKQMRFVSS
jgi:hypothetical protein